MDATIYEILTVLVPDEGIYVLRIFNPSLFWFVSFIRIEQIPASDQSINFLTSVVWATVYDSFFYIRQVKVLKLRYNLTGANIKSTHTRLND